MSFLIKVQAAQDSIKHIVFEKMPTRLKRVLDRNDDFYTLDRKENPARIVLNDENINGVVLYQPGDFFSAPKSYFVFQLKGNRIIWDRDITRQSNYSSWGERKVTSQPVLDWIHELKVYPKPVKYSDYLKGKAFLEPYL